MEDRFRYDCSGTWFKGNIHMHTVNSDGRLTPAEAAAFYADAGYDFIAITDHMVSFVASDSDADWPLVMLDGVELHGEDEHGALYHVVCLGGVDGVKEGMPLMEALKRVRAQDSFLIWAHPHWSGNTVSDGLRYEFHGMEVCNYSSQLSIGKGMGMFHWDAVLEQNPNMLAFAVDDTHFVKGFPGELGAWITVNAPEASSDAIMASIRQGNFYSSIGPSFESIIIEKRNRVVAETSPIVHARLIGPRSTGKYKNAGDKDSMTDTHFRIPDDWTYARLEIEDTNGRIAWSNPLLR